MLNEYEKGKGDEEKQQFRGNVIPKVIWNNEIVSILRREGITWMNARKLAED